jgi:hypothetical protein
MEETGKEDAEAGREGNKNEQASKRSKKVLSTPPYFPGPEFDFSRRRSSANNGKGRQWYGKAHQRGQTLLGRLAER